MIQSVKVIVQRMPHELYEEKEAYRYFVVSARDGDELRRGMTFFHSSNAALAAAAHECGSDWRIDFVEFE